MRVLARTRRRPANGPPADPAEVERVVYERIYRYPRRCIDNIRPLERAASAKAQPKRGPSKPMPRAKRDGQAAR